MCGRFSVSDRASAIAAEMLPGAAPLPANYNVAPTAQVSVVRQWQGERVMPSVKWGYVPTWAKDFQKQHPQPINAKIENLTSSSMWRKSFQSARAVVPMDSYYEWTVTETGKQPHRIFNPDRGLLAAAVIGAWPDPAKDDDDPEKWRLSMAIITRDAHVAPGEVHDRMPALLDVSDVDDWLGDHLSPDELMAMLDHQSHALAHDLTHYEVSRDVNSVRHNGPALIEPLPAAR